MKKRVIIVGSYNVGLFLKGKSIPKTGETLMGDVFYEGGGGKGSNQAIAASRLGAKTTFIGRIGKDKYGSDALDMYRQNNIKTDLVEIDKNMHTGISVIFIDDKGRNSIMVVPGANYNLSKKCIDSISQNLDDSCIVGFQLENKIDIVEYGIKKTSSVGARVLLDPAPAVKLDKDTYKHIYYIKPNEHEAEVLTGIPVKDVESAAEAGKWFIDKGVHSAILTLGEKGAVLVESNIIKHYPTPEINAVDTTGAGDCFSGALLSKLSNNESIETAITFANYASALSVTKFGVVEALPSVCEVEDFISKMK